LLRPRLNKSLYADLETLLAEGDELKRIFSSTIINLEKKSKD
jgi:hypothetical protein